MPSSLYSSVGENLEDYPNIDVLYDFYITVVGKCTGRWTVNKCFSGTEKGFEDVQTITYSFTGD